MWAEGADGFDFISGVSELLYPFVPRAQPGSESVCQEDLCPTLRALPEKCEASLIEKQFLL